MSAAGPDTWRDLEAEHERELPAREADAPRYRPPARSDDDDRGALWHSLSFVAGMLFGAIIGAGVTILVLALIVVVGVAL